MTNRMELAAQVESESISASEYEAAITETRRDMLAGRPPSNRVAQVQPHAVPEQGDAEAEDRSPLLWAGAVLVAVLFIGAVVALGIPALVGILK